MGHAVEEAPGLVEHAEAGVSCEHGVEGEEVGGGHPAEEAASVVRAAAEEVKGEQVIGERRGGGSTEEAGEAKEEVDAAG